MHIQLSKESLDEIKRTIKAELIEEMKKDQRSNKRCTPQERIRSHIEYKLDEIYPGSDQYSHDRHLAYTTISNFVKIAHKKRYMGHFMDHELNSAIELSDVLLAVVKKMRRDGTLY